MDLSVIWLKIKIVRTILDIFHERRSKVNIEQNFINKFGTAVSNLAIFCLSNCKVVFEHNEFRTKTKSYIIPGKLNEFMYRKEHDCRREQDNWI